MNDLKLLEAWIAGSIAIFVGGMGALVAVYVHRQEQAASMIVAALAHMGGGAQERGAGLAALDALHDRTLPHRAWVLRRVWKAYAPAVARQLYRQLTYVLNYGHRRGYQHEVENLIVMLDWLTTQPELQLKSRGIRERLIASLETYKCDAERKPSPAGLAFDARFEGWLRALRRGSNLQTARL